MRDRQIGLCLIDHVRFLDVSFRESLVLEKGFYTIIICLVAHKVAQETALAVDDAGITVNNVSKLASNRIVRKFLLKLLF